jgi:glutathione-regulated potassium-efflux system ancillary protein KefC/glutathione-regulated potassium-efflux system protein KefB
MSLLEQSAIFLLTAVLLVPLFQRFKLGAILGYLASGMLVGPWGFGIVANVESTLHFAEFGVVLLLFLIGLELQPARLWALRRPVFGSGGAQVIVTAVVIGAIALSFGLSWPAALITGFAAAMSSTALVLSALGEKGELGAAHGRESFAILLFQDLAVIPLLALLPLLAGEAHVGGGLAALKSVAAVAVVIVLGRIAVRPLLKFIATHGSREVFTAAALLLVIGTAVVMQKIGLSMALGAFLAGVLLADSEFTHELRADIEPFKGLLLGLFFMAVGMSADLGRLAAQPLTVIGLALLLMTVKAALLYALLRLRGSGNETAQRTAVLLSQGGEFAFVLLATAAAMGAISSSQSQLLVLVVTLSMLLAPASFALHERLLNHWLARSAPPPFDSIDEPATPVIIAGFGRYGQIVSRVLRMCGVRFTALEANYQQVDFVRRFGNKVYFGDASRLELLEAAKAGEAKLFVLAIDDVEASVRTAEVVRRHFPKLPILARARNRLHWFRLRDLGISAIYRETFPSSLEAAHRALLQLGLGVAAAEHAIALFRGHDEEQLAAQYAIHHDEKQLIQSARDAAQQLQELFEADATGPQAGFPQADDRQ